MRWHHLLFAAAATVGSLLSNASFAADWITAPSSYTHDWSSGERVAQYSPIGPFYYYTRPDYLKSGYRQYRSTIDLGNSSDNMHVVEQWGAPVVPYEQWRFPYRPYSAPYPAWGPPYGGLGGGTGGYPYSGGNGANIFGGFFPPYGGYGFGGPGYGGPGYGALSAPGSGGPGMGGPGGFPGGFPGTFFPPAVNFAQPWLDGHYPSYDLNDRSQYWRPYQPAAPGGGPGMGGPGGFPGSFFPPAVNFAQPWLDGHYPSYDLNDRSQYWRPYQSPPGSH
jgi:hypothetical protein